MYRLHDLITLSVTIDAGAAQDSPATGAIIVEEFET
jgi:hypothetical protein